MVQAVRIVGVNSFRAGLARYLDALPDRIISQSYNRSADKLKSLSSKSLAAKKKLALKLVRPQMPIRKSNAKTLKADLLGIMRDIPAIRITGVRRVKRGDPGVKAGQHFFPDAFIATMPRKNYKGVFHRVILAGGKRAPRLPIDESVVPLEPEGTQTVIAEAPNAEKFLVDELDRRILTELQKI